MTDRDAMSFLQNLQEESTNSAKPRVIHVNCPDCGREYKLSGDKVGKRFKCRDCSSVVSVPGQSPQNQPERTSPSALDLNRIHGLHGVQKGVTMEYWAIITELMVGISAVGIVMMSPRLLPFIILLMLLPKALKITARCQCLSGGDELVDSTVMGLSLFFEVGVLVLGGMCLLRLASSLMLLAMIGLPILAFASPILFAAYLKQLGRSLRFHEVPGQAGRAIGWMIAAGGSAAVFPYRRYVLGPDLGVLFGLFVFITLIGSLVSYGRLLDGTKKRLQMGRMGTNV